MTAAKHSAEHISGFKHALDVSFTKHLLVKLSQRVAAIALIRESHKRLPSRLSYTSFRSW